MYTRRRWVCSEEKGSEMNWRLGKVFLAAAVALAAGTGAAFAGTTGNLAYQLFNTGVDANKTVLAAGVIDPNYDLVSVPSGPSDALAMSAHPAWVANTSDSKWIGPLADGQATSPAGNYVYRYTFDLTNFFASTANIEGRWATDNNAQMKLNLNGVSTTPNEGFKGWTYFVLNKGFVAGTNTLEFCVTNQSGSSGNPTGLRVEFLSGCAQPIPEPVFFQMGSLLGLGGLGLLKGRKR